MCFRLPCSTTQVSPLFHRIFDRDYNLIEIIDIYHSVEDTDTTFEELETNFGPEVTSIVREVTDDKNLPREERKRLQIVHAAESSHSAKLVKLADKLYNLRDLTQSCPKGWTGKRREEYFVWAKQVVDGLRGTCQPLESELDKIFQARGIQ